MDLEERIARRQRSTDAEGLVACWPPLDPTVHLDEPVGRGPVVERLLDALDPVFAGALPANAYVHGPAGAGKSAVVTAVLGALRDHLSPPTGTIGTTTRAPSNRSPAFAYVDARLASTPFALHRATLAAVTAESVPRRGVGTDALRGRLRDVVRERPGVVAVDHVGEPGTLTLDVIREEFDALSESLAWMAVGRTSPESVTGDVPSAVVDVPAYRRSTLENVLTTRASRAFNAGLDHDHVRDLAGWADGDAHDALAALFHAAARATDVGRDVLHDADLDAGTAEVPRDGVPVARVLALPENRKRVLDHFVDHDLSGGGLEAVAETVAEHCDLSATTVTRFLYELAEDGILARVRPSDGRGPSQVDARFPVHVYRELRRRHDET